MIFLSFVQGADSASGKTRTWFVTAATSNLGMVAWYGPWMKYCYFPCDCAPTVLDRGCLIEIAEFCAAQTIRHRAGV